MTALQEIVDESRRIVGVKLPSVYKDEDYQQCVARHKNADVPSDVEQIVKTVFVAEFANACYSHRAFETPLEKVVGIDEGGALGLLYGKSLKRMGRIASICTDCDEAMGQIRDETFRSICDAIDNTNAYLHKYKNRKRLGYHVNVSLNHEFRENIFSWLRIYFYVRTFGVKNIVSMNPFVGPMSSLSEYVWAGGVVSKMMTAVDGCAEILRDAVEMYGGKCHHPMYKEGEMIANALLCDIDLLRICASKYPSEAVDGALKLRGFEANYRIRIDRILERPQPEKGVLGFLGGLLKQKKYKVFGTVLQGTVFDGEPIGRLGDLSYLLLSMKLTELKRAGEHTCYLCHGDSAEMSVTITLGIAVNLKEGQILSCTSNAGSFIQQLGMYGSIELLQRFMWAGWNANEKDENGMTILRQAVKREREMVRFLVEEGQADVATEGPELLEIAAGQLGRSAIEVVRYLVEECEAQGLTVERCKELKIQNTDVLRYFGVPMEEKVKADCVL